MIEADESPPFDISGTALSSFDSRDQYLEFCGRSYFSECAQKRVLEIGPYHGDHSRHIIAGGADQLHVIEANAQVVDHLRLIEGIDDIILDDAMLWLQRPRPYDVVVCFGVLYHLHSPLHLLELIVNNCGPDRIMLDCVMSADPLQFLPEDIHMAGNRQIRSGWKACGLNLVVPFLTYLEAMDDLGYQCTKVHRISVQNYFPKSHVWMANWEKKK